MSTPSVCRNKAHRRAKRVDSSGPLTNHQRRANYSSSEQHRDVSMNASRIFAIALMAVPLAGCPHFVSTQIDVVPARDVINAVKEELAPLADKSTATMTVKKGDCSANDTVAVVVEKTSVDIALKTVSTRTDSPTGGATNFPV